MTAYASSAEQWESMSAADRRAAVRRLEQRESERELQELLRAIQSAANGIKNAEQLQHLEAALDRLERLVKGCIHIKKTA